MYTKKYLSNQKNGLLDLIAGHFAPVPQAIWIIGIGWMFICCIMFTSCSMKTTNLSILRPGALDLPVEINTIATIDRSVPPKGFADVLEGAVSGEGIGEDRAGRREAIEAVTATIDRSPRYEIQLTGIEEKKERSIHGFDRPLSDQKVADLCSRHAAEAIIALEYFDSDHSKEVSPRSERRKTDSGDKITLHYFVSNMSTRVHLGWRLYYKDGRILDEHSVEENVNFSGRGDTEQEAFHKLPDRRETIVRASREAGIQYGARLVPLPEDLKRRYYTKASEAWNSTMEKASRAVRTDQWESAAKIWRTIYYKAEDQKTKGRTAYNLALAGEARGQLSLAKYWAEEAWVTHDIKKAQSYLESLKQRIEEQGRLEQQLRTDQSN